MNDLFKGIAANDSKDLVNFIIMTLHEELNKVQVNNINNEIPSTPSIKENKIIPIKKTSKIRELFKHCPGIGLQNIGATCYMNATLQCFCHIERFVNYFKYNHNVINLVKGNKQNLTSSFKLLIEKFVNFFKYSPQVKKKQKKIKII